MFKYLLIAMSLVACSLALGFDPQQNKDDKSVHHAAMHAENWVNHHTSAPHGKNAIRRKKSIRRKVKSVHHAAMHAEHWIDHHVSAPHHNSGN